MPDLNMNCNSKRLSFLERAPTSEEALTSGGGSPAERTLSKSPSKCVMGAHSGAVRASGMQSQIRLNGSKNNSLIFFVSPKTGKNRGGIIKSYAMQRYLVLKNPSDSEWLCVYTKPRAVKVREAKKTSDKQSSVSVTPPSDPWVNNNQWVNNNESSYINSIFRWFKNGLNWCVARFLEIHEKNDELMRLHWDDANTIDVSLLNENHSGDAIFPSGENNSGSVIHDDKSNRDDSSQRSKSPSSKNNIGTAFCNNAYDASAIFNGSMHNNGNAFSNNEGIRGPTSSGLAESSLKKGWFETYKYVGNYFLNGCWLSAQYIKDSCIKGYHASNKYLAGILTSKQPNLQDLSLFFRAGQNPQVGQPFQAGQANGQDDVHPPDPSPYPPNLFKKIRFESIKKSLKDSLFESYKFLKKSFLNGFFSRWVKELYEKLEEKIVNYFLKLLSKKDLKDFIDRIVSNYIYDKTIKNVDKRLPTFIANYWKVASDYWKGERKK